MKDLAKFGVGFCVLCVIGAIVAGVFLGVGFLLPAYSDPDPPIFARLLVGFTFTILGAAIFALVLFFSWYIGSRIFKN